MASKKQYYKLDDIGFVGTQDRRSEAECKKDIELTIAFVKKRKAESGIADTPKEKFGLPKSR